MGQLVKLQGEEDAKKAKAGSHRELVKDVAVEELKNELSQLKQQLNLVIQERSSSAGQLKVVQHVYGVWVNGGVCAAVRCQN